MEVQNGVDFLILAMFEIFGTFLLTLGMNVGYKFGPDAVSAGLFIAILLTYRVTGSHFNAGITLSVAIVEKAGKQAREKLIIVTYIIAQLIGGYLGMAVTYALYGDARTMDMKPSDTSQNIFYVLLVEFIFSWILMTIYMHAKCDWVAPS